MNIDIKLHKEDLPDQLSLSDNIAVDCAVSYTHLTLPTNPEV